MDSEAADAAAKPLPAQGRDDLARGATAISGLLSEHWPAEPVGPTYACTERLRRLATLYDGWDGRGAFAPSRLAVDLAHDLLRIAAHLGAPFERVVADVEGGVAIYAFGGGHVSDGGCRLQAGILVSNSGDLCFYSRDRSTSGAVVEDVAVQDAADAVRRVRSSVRRA